MFLVCLVNIIIISRIKKCMFSMCSLETGKPQKGDILVNLRCYLAIVDSALNWPLEMRLSSFLNKTIIVVVNLDKDFFSHGFATRYNFKDFSVKKIR